MSRALSNPVRIAAPSQGLDGRTTLAKARAPLVTDGRIGDFFIDTAAKKLYGPKNAAGWPDNGLIKGDKGWVPILAAVADGTRRVHRVVDWQGGEGTKPATGSYVGATGLVPLVADAIDMRGQQGPAMLIDSLTAGADDVGYDDNAPVAKAGDDNERQPLKRVLGAGGLLQFDTVAAAAALVVPASVKAVQINGASDAQGGPGHIRRRVDTEPVSDRKHRSADRFTADGGVDSVNGGWWVAATGKASASTPDADGKEFSTPADVVRRMAARFASAKDYSGVFPANWASAFAAMPSHAVFVKDLWVGTASEDEDGNYVPNAGALFFGGFNESGNPFGVRVRQEGFSDDFETGSLALYAVEGDRWCGLSIAPSGNPWDLPSENVASIACQLRNGAAEERITITSKWFGNEATGIGEYRIAAVSTGIGKYWPITLSNNDRRLAYVGTLGGGDIQDIVRFTNERFDYTSGGNTFVSVENPGISGALHLIARATDGVVGLERATYGDVDYEIRLLQSRVEYTGPELRLAHGQPTLWFQETDQAADVKNWFMDAAGGQLRITLANDAVNSFSTALAMARSGSAITEINFAPVIGTTAALPSAASDAAAASAGVRLYGFYQNAGAIRQRLT